VNRLQLELAVQDAAGARVARAVGADCVELCSALRATGGVTPSMATIEHALAVGPLPVHVLVRCRPGPFVYTHEELTTMGRDAVLAARAGAYGVVIGALTEAGAIDIDATIYLRDAVWAAMPTVQVSFHRAMDVAIASGQAAAAMDDLMRLGVARVLTSGAAARSIDGLATLGRLAKQAAGRIQIVAGGGVRPEDVEALARAGVDAVHMSASTSIARPGASSGPGGGSSDAIDVTDQDAARAAAAAVATVNAQARG